MRTIKGPYWQGTYIGAKAINVADKLLERTELLDGQEMILKVILKRK